MFVNHRLLKSMLFCITCTFAQVNATPQNNETTAGTWKDIATYEVSKSYDLTTIAGRNEAQIIIGDQYASKSTKQEDVDKAIYWYTQAAEAGSTEAMFLLGKYYNLQPKEMPSVVPGESLSVYWLSKAGKLGHLASITLLKQYYLDLGKNKDAAFWLLKSIELGDVTANMILGDLYFQGPAGINKDLSKAMEFYTAAAKKNHAPSQMRLGVAYFKGLGIEQNAAKAYQWLTLASNNGNPTAKSYLETQILPTITSEQIKLGEAEVSNFNSNN